MLLSPLVRPFCCEVTVPKRLIVTYFKESDVDDNQENYSDYNFVHCSFYVYWNTK